MVQSAPFEKPQGIYLNPSESICTYFKYFYFPLIPISESSIKMILSNKAINQDEREEELSNTDFYVNYSFNLRPLFHIAIW